MQSLATPSTNLSYFPWTMQGYALFWRKLYPTCVPHMVVHAINRIHSFLLNAPFNTSLHEWIAVIDSMYNHMMHDVGHNFSYSKCILTWTAGKYTKLGANDQTNLLLSSWMDKIWWLSMTSQTSIMKTFIEPQTYDTSFVLNVITLPLFLGVLSIVLS